MTVREAPTGPVAPALRAAAGHAVYETGWPRFAASTALATVFQEVGGRA